MNLTNYHSHSLYCDGRANMEDFIRFALSEGFTSYGFSSHAPLPFPTAWTMEWDCMDDYLAEFRRLKAKYAGQIELYIGLEIDYLNEESNPSVARFRELPLDYRIGSVHLLYNDKGEVVDVDVTADKFRKLVDEILAVGDANFQEKCKQRMRQLMGGGTTVLFVSHSMEQIREMCNRVLWLDNGKVKMLGDTQTVCDSYNI